MKNRSFPNEKLCHAFQFVGWSPFVDLTIIKKTWEIFVLCYSKSFNYASRPPFVFRIQFFMDYVLLCFKINAIIIWYSYHAFTIWHLFQMNWMINIIIALSLAKILFEKIFILECLRRQRFNFLPSVASIYPTSFLRQI